MFLNSLCLFQVALSLGCIPLHEPDATQDHVDADYRWVDPSIARVPIPPD
jgi:hypothetical protein